MRSARAIFLFTGVALLATNALVRSVPADDICPNARSQAALFVVRNRYARRHHAAILLKG